MSEHVNKTTDADFEADVLKASVPVLVDFWAEWCHPCRMLAPVVDEVAKEFAGRVKFYKVNVDDNGQIPTKYGVSSIPSLLLFKDGDVVASRVGMASRSQLIAFVDENI